MTPAEAKLLLQAGVRFFAIGGEWEVVERADDGILTQLIRGGGTLFTKQRIGFDFDKHSCALSMVEQTDQEITNEANRFNGR